MDATSSRKKIYASASIAIVMVVLLITIGFGLGNSSTGQATNTAPSAVNNIVPSAANTGAVKEFKITMSGGSYQPNPITVNKGDRVKLVADMNSIGGCYKTIVIPQFDVRKTVSSSDNIIEFTASEAGTFQMTCGMGMAQGSIVVKDASGNVPATTDVSAQSASSGGTCGASGGGCGCGG